MMVVGHIPAVFREPGVEGSVCLSYVLLITLIDCGWLVAYPQSSEKPDWGDLSVSPIYCLGHFLVVVGHILAVFQEP